jgi:hypothetical protein
MKRRATTWAALLTVASGAGVSAQQTIDPWVFADRLVASLGGRAVWAAARTLYVRESAYPPSIAGPVTVEIWRDLQAPAYRSILRGSGIQRELHFSEQVGWRVRDGVRTTLSAQELAEEIADWRTEPYVLYHRLARRDSTLRLVMRSPNRLDVFDNSGSDIIGWFVADSAGALLLWGNYYQGQISEHVYGPLRPLGRFRMPAWGAATDGSWRFEYVEIRASPEPLIIRMTDPRRPD